MLIKKSSVH